MSTKYPLISYCVTYNCEEKRFYLTNSMGEVIATNDFSGRELGREAWDMDAEEVVYKYNLRIDEDLPLKSRYEKYKT